MTARILGLTPGIWAIASRPKTLPASIVPVCIGIAFVFSRSSVAWSTALVILVAAVLLQIATNIVNDLADFEKGADTAERTGPLRVTQAGLATPQQMRRAAAFILLLALLLGSYLVYLGGLSILLIGLAAMIAAVCYTAGPFPLGYLGLGELFVFAFFGPVAVGGTVALLSGDFSFQGSRPGIAPGLIATALLCVNNLRDRETDAKSGKRTLAVRFGKTFARWEYVFCIVTAGILPLGEVLFAEAPPLSALSALYLIPAILPMSSVLKNNDPAGLNLALERTGKLLLAYGSLYVAGCLLS